MTVRAIFGAAAALSFLAAVLLVALLVWQLRASSNNSDNSSRTYPILPPTLNASPTPFPFRVSSIPAHFRSTLPLTAAYEVAIPADSQWHDTHISVQAGHQMLINYLRGTSGHVEYLTGKRHWDIYHPLADEAWYEQNFINSGEDSEWNTVVPGGASLKVKSFENNIFLRVEIRKRN